MRLSPDDAFEYDLKMVSRNINDRKQQAQSVYQDIMRVSEEQARINAAKLRYISCIAHDLKTPLQSFSFTMDLLVQTALSAEQREFVEQTTVAVDLMKLTISQTMDISKALSGVKPLPRCEAVQLSVVVERVKVIINGYGKQVPVSFEVAKDVCDTIITDEEWLWQMMLNLLTNACKYTDRGSILVRIRLDSDLSLSASSGHSSSFAVIGSAKPIANPIALLVEVVDTGRYHCFGASFSCMSLIVMLFLNRCGCSGGQAGYAIRRFLSGAGWTGDGHRAGTVRCAHPCRGPGWQLWGPVQHTVLYWHWHSDLVHHPLCLSLIHI